MDRPKIVVPKVPFEIIKEGLQEKFPSSWFRSFSQSSLIVGKESVDIHGRANIWIRNYGQVLLGMERQPSSLPYDRSQSDDYEMWRREHIGHLRQVDETIRGLGYDPKISSSFLESDDGLTNLALAFQMYQPVVGKSSVVFDYDNGASDTPIKEHELVDRIVVGFIPWTFDLRQRG